MTTMVERIATVETKLDIIDNKLTKFIDSADGKYASKKEFEDFKSGVKNKEQVVSNRIWDVTLKILPWALAVLITLINLKDKLV